jgi:predicted DNA-binding transcriptional regulator AlpA
MTDTHSAGAVRPERLTIQEYAPYIGVAVQTAYQWRSKGIGPRTYKLGNRVHADKADLDLWLVQQKAATLAGA